MSSAKSRWADNAEEEVQRKREKEEKKRAKLEKQRQAEEEEVRRKKAEEEAAARKDEQNREDSDRPTKRRRLSHDGEDSRTKEKAEQPRKLLRFAAPAWGPCRHVDNFERLNHIEEGSYGWVSRARETATAEVVALKKLKMDNLNDGFPVTALREIQTLKESSHTHIVDLREVVVGDTLDDVFIVMEFVEHDLKTLQDSMSEPFLPSETKTLMAQLTSAVAFLHSHWILHRDLKTSNILMNNQGEIKLADFGMARYTGDPPPPNLTQLVVTLWYRAPELLLGAKTYGFEIDLWSVGCIFGELLQKEPILQGKNEVDQISKILTLMGIPTDTTWPGFRRLPNARSLRLPPNPPPHATKPNIRRTFALLTNAGVDLLLSLLSLNPDGRPSAAEVLDHPYFKEDPKPKAKEMFPTFPSKAGQEKQRRRDTPSAPKRGEGGKVEFGAVDLSGLFGAEREEGGAGFQLRMG
ncbi:serine/threonine-protein kinase ppk23 [Rhizodiscina lignyota]|uniref:cyclin-dependent kinase n=1 Tax=Rhizodiscina lignyota TaxID=1504668 RepID=A0A9P4M7D6_9PEZI|nr:serine/threonine-protein kinase ppk23 [Rhizodiscina lignyota]